MKAKAGAVQGPATRPEAAPSKKLDIYPPLLLVTLFPRRSWVKLILIRSKNDSPAIMQTLPTTKKEAGWEEIWPNNFPLKEAISPNME